MTRGATSHLLFRTSGGWMGVAASGSGIRAIVLPRPSRGAIERLLDVQPAIDGSLAASGSERHDTVTLLRDARSQLLAFMAGERRSLDFPVDLSSGSSFQRRVWRAILKIPYGRVRSYVWVAERVGGRQYARAVGHALGANPVPIMVPCHRVVAYNGSLGGFTGGLHLKRRLLTLEGTLSQLSEGRVGRGVRR